MKTAQLKFEEPRIVIAQLLTRQDFSDILLGFKTKHHILCGTPSKPEHLKLKDDGIVDRVTDQYLVKSGCYAIWNQTKRTYFITSDDTNFIIPQDLFTPVIVTPVEFS
jgi:hypothetical protein